MIALGNPSWRPSKGPLLGRRYKPARKGQSIMAKLWEGLRKDRSCGTYIRPHSGGYEYGRWWHGLFGDYRFEKLGDEPTVEACKLGFELVDKAVDRRATQLNKRQRRRRA